MEGDAAPVQLEQSLREGEPEPRSLDRPAELRIQRSEFVEDALLVLGRDPDPGVADFDRHFTSASPCPHTDPATIRRELDGIREQVYQDLTRVARVGEQVAGMIVVEAELDGPRLRQGLDRGEDLEHQLADLHRLGVHLHPSRLDLGHVEEVVDQPQQVLAARVDRLEAGVLIEDRPHRALTRLQRHLQLAFVRHRTSFAAGARTSITVHAMAGHPGLSSGRA